jgi:hypothetical protein
MLLASFAASPTAAQTPTDDLDCEDFGSQQAAQQHLNADPTDPDNLDADNDGLACETYPYGSGGGSSSQSGGTAGSDAQSLYVSDGTWGPGVFDGASDDHDAHGTYTHPTKNVAVDHDCADFATQEAAQSYLGAGLPDSDGLDADNDGVACEDYFKSVPQPTHLYPITSEEVTEYTSAPNPPSIPVITKITPPSTGDAGLVVDRP